MTILSRAAIYVAIAAFSVLLVGPAQANGTGPAATPSARPTPGTQRAPAARPTASRPVAARPAAHQAAARPATPLVAQAAATTMPDAALPMVSLSGTIVGTDGQPRPGVSVFPTTNPRLLAVTDATGTFKLQVPASAGPLRLQADYFGLGSSRVEVDGQHPQPVHIVLGQ